MPFLLLTPCLLAQQNGNPAFDTDTVIAVSAGSDSAVLGSWPVLQNSIRLRDTSGERIEIDYQFRPGPPAVVVFSVPLPRDGALHYQRIKAPLQKTYRHKDTALIIPETVQSDPREDQLYRRETESFAPFEGLNSQGSIARSVSLGNNQDAVLNSSLNLQLTGNLGSNTQIRATINDNNVPVQADGYTQQLREFDRVYIELENPDFGLLRAGDYNMQNQRSYFLNFDKRISGAGIFADAKAGEGNIPLQLQGGIARGQFARNRFRGQEGNQGPYKLQGNNGEQFIIIISGSERVYIDGILQKRGEQYDYVMDYNAGEITFTANRPITKDKRITVEFQYSQRNYLRPIIYGQSGFENEKVRVSVSHYSESDNENQPLTTELSDFEKQKLSEVGDDLEDAVIPTIVPSEFDDDRILYELRDTLGVDSVLVYSRDSTRQLYQASFTLVGANQGNYRLANNAANGRVFEWVAPQNGVPQGNYAPVKRLTAPNKLAITNLQAAVDLGKNQDLNLDLAVSDNDINLFSDRDEGNDIGTAGRLDYGYHIPAESGQWQGGVQLEYNQDKFRTIERIRNVEFGRDWNLPLNFNSGLVLAQTSIGYQNEEYRANYNLGFLQTGPVQGLKHRITGTIRDSLNRGRLELSWLSSEDSLKSTNFLRERFRYRHFLKTKWWLGSSSEGEWNYQRALATDSLLFRSYSFLEAEAFTGWGDTTASFLEAGYRFRHDDTARGGSLQNFSLAHTGFLRSTINTNFNSRLSLFANFRNLKITRPEEQPWQRTLTSRINYVQRFFNNAISSTTFYETGSGTEPRRDFRYVEVPAGQGTYTHTDYNENGQKELDEFEVAPTPDLATYVRVFTPSSEFLRTSVVKLGQNLNINAPSTWSGKKDWREDLAKFSVLANFQVNRKTLLEGNVNGFNPFTEPAADSLIVALNNNFRSTLFFNRAQNKFGGDYTFRQTDSRNLVSFGIEQRSVTENELNLRYSPLTDIILRGGAINRQKRNRSGNFSQRNYLIRTWEQRYSVTYQVGKNFSLTGEYLWQDKRAEAENGASLQVQNAGLESVWNVADKVSMRLEARYIFNAFEGEANSPVGYEMLRELQPGSNGTWDIALQKTIFENILLSLKYNGRVAGDRPPVHFGNMEVKAFF